MTSVRIPSVPAEVVIYDGVGEVETMIIIIAWKNEGRGDIGDRIRLCRVAVVSEKLRLKVECVVSDCLGEIKKCGSMLLLY